MLGKSFQAHHHSKRNIGLPPSRFAASIWIIWPLPKQIQIICSTYQDLSVEPKSNSFGPAVSGVSYNMHILVHNWLSQLHQLEASQCHPWPDFCQNCYRAQFDATHQDFSEEPKMNPFCCLVGELCHFQCLSFCHTTAKRVVLVILWTWPPTHDRQWGPSL